MPLVLRNRTYVLLDVVGWVLIAAIALALRLDGFGSLAPFGRQLLLFLTVAIPCKLLAVWRLGLYQRYWRYASVDELVLVGLAVLAAALPIAILYLVLEPVLGTAQHLPRSVLILDPVLTLLYLGGARFTPRLVDHLRLKAQGRDHWERVLIAGAGVTGGVIARELMANRQIELYPVGFVDDDPGKRGSTIQSVPVLGGCHEIPVLARDYGVSTVIIAMPTVPGTVIREIREICDQAKLRTKIIPGVGEIISGRVSVSHLRDVQIDDLLGRTPVRIDERAAGDLVRGATVLVTGAGGSIGSEICRQISLLGASEVILLGHGENSIFDVLHELSVECPATKFVPVIADVRDAARMDRIFGTYRPQAVFHAAAHKHVSLMEMNPEEAVVNNVLGTLNVVVAAERADVKRFVLISTDKAVNPGNIMGATKLVAERVVHDVAMRSNRPYVSVRFGNVLASRGSVVPLFKKQIAQGGPVTVTHPGICRYFMTIPEAVQLVLQAAAFGKRGETFVLDMGEAVSILQLAKDLIHLSGLEVDRDIKISFTGLRSGEKLVEELFGRDEEVAHTPHEKVFVVRNGKPGPGGEARVRELVEAAQACDGLRVRHLLTEEAQGTRADDQGHLAGGGQRETLQHDVGEARAANQ
jgi:FlaA1/EpsC-like NDP-sugar epimerase